MKKFYLMGDIIHTGVVVVEAETLDEAINKAEVGDDFEVWDEQDKHLLFKWNEDKDSVTEGD